MDVFGGAPRFLAYPRPVVVQSGTDAVLKCQIGGDPRPAVIWERNNEQIHPEGRYRLFEDGNVYNLIISSVTTEDSGQYTCKAKNSIGETYAAATLKVEGEAQEMELREENKPRFLIKPLSTRVGRGEDAVFSCKLWGNPRPEVVWEKDGRKLNEIFESTHFNVGYQDGGWFQLKIFKTRAPDGGVYTCKARNEFGEGLAGAVLLVDAGPGHEEEGNRNGYTNGHWKGHQGKQRSGRQLTTRLKDDPVTNQAKQVKMFAVTEGKHAKFRCFVTGKPKPEIIWRKDGRLIMSGRRYLLYEDREGYFTLKVLYCKQQDNGVYVCAASNTAGQTLSAVHLSVKEPPVRFKQPLIDLEVWERDLAVLECEVPEDSVPITWYLEDRRLQPGAKYGMEEWGTKRRLTIRDIGVDDDGIYLCEMADGGRSIAEVAVKGTIVRKLPRKVDVLEGENAAFCVEVEEEEMDIHWYKEGTELRETHQTILKSFGKTHILVFVNTTPQDSGLVTFFVGRSKTSSQLRVKAARHSPPSCPVGVQINTERANAALLSWVPAQDTRKNPPSGYVLERQEVGTGSQEWLQCLTTDSATSVEILGDSVPCEADYRFRICSVNKYGRSNNVEFPRAVHLVPVTRIQAPLQDALVPEGQDACFSIELTASVIGSWFLNGTQLLEDDRYSMRRSRTHQSLRIQGVRDTDNGAEITFIAYGIRDSAALYIQAPLVKFTPLSEMDRNKFVELGNPIVLYCELSDPAVPVHWYKNGVEVHTVEGLHIQSEGTMRRIVIQSSEFSHSGVYCCDAIDDVIRFNVEVEAPPVRFSALPEAVRNKSIEAGCPIVLQCELSDPTAQVYWYKDGTKLLPQSGIEIQSDGITRTLVVQSAEIFYSGSYSCKTKGDAIKFNVEVKVPPVRFSVLPEAERNRVIEAGCPIVLKCELSDPTAQVYWYKDGIQLFSNHELDIQSEGNMRTLVVQSAELTHSGTYSCTTVDDTMEFHVDIKAVPVTFSAIFDVEKTKSVEAGCPFQLQCEVTDPTAQVYWCKDGEKLLPQTGMDIQSNGTMRKLIVQSAGVFHSGLYNCETSDDTLQFTVDIKAPPVKFLPSPEVVKSQPFQATCPIELPCEISDPIAQVSRQKDKVEPISDTGPFEMGGIRRNLVVQPAHPSNSGAYYCATAEDVAPLIVQNQAPPMTYLVAPEVEKNKSIEAGLSIVQQFEISDPIAQVCWDKDGTQIYPHSGLDRQSKGSMRTLFIQPDDMSCGGRFDCQTTGDTTQCNVAIKAELSHPGSEKGEISDESSQYTMDIKAAPVRVSADQAIEKNKSIEEVCPVEVHCEPLDSTVQILHYKYGQHLQTYGIYSTETPSLQSVEHFSIETPTVQSAEHYSMETATLHSPELFGSMETATFQSAELYGSMQTPTVQSAELYGSMQTPTVQSAELYGTMHTPTHQSAEVCGSMQTLTLQSAELYDSMQTQTLQSAELYGSIHTPTHQSAEVCGSMQTLTLQSAELYDSMQTQTLQSAELYGSIHTPTHQSAEVCGSMQTLTFQSAELYDSMQTQTLQSAELYGSIHTPTHQSAEVCGSMQTPTLQSAELYDSMQTQTLQSAELYGSIHTPTHQSAEVCGSTQTPTFHPTEVCGSVQTPTLQSAELCCSMKTPTLQSAELYTSMKTPTLQPAELYQLGECDSQLDDDDIAFKVDVEAPPVRITTPCEAERNKSVAAGGPIVLRCEISDPNAHVSWYKDGTLLHEENGLEMQSEGSIRTLDVESARLSDSGSYSCKTTDDAMQFHVDVKAPPPKFSAISEADKKKYIKSGYPIVLQCELSDPTIKVYWYKDGTKLLTQSGVDIQSDGTMRTLVIQSAELSHSGVYRCETMEDGLQFTVEVKAPPVRFSALPEAERNKFIEDGCPIILQCELSDPTAQVYWYKDGTKLLSQSGMEIQSDGIKRTLLIQSAEILHGGTYECSTAGDTITFKVEIKAPPVTFVDIPEEDLFKSVVEQDRLVMSCEVSRVDAIVQWYKDGVETQSSDNIAVHADCTVRMLTIQSAQLSDSGTYTCRAGDRALMFKVNIREPPVMIVYPKEDVHLDRHVPEEIILSCELSRLNGVVNWFKDGQKLQESENIKLKIEGPYRRLKILCSGVEDSGEYVCDTADDSIFFNLSITEPPVQIISPSQSQMELCQQTSERMVLSCEISRPNAVVRWYRDGLEVEENDNLILEVDGVYRRLIIPETTVKDSAEYVCDTADDNMTFFVNIADPPVRFVRPRKMASRVEMFVGDSLVLDCEVSRSNATVSWKKNGEEMEESSNVTVIEDGVMRQLTIHSMTLEDAGQYVCDAKDDVMDFQVKIKETPVKILSKNNVNTQKQFFASDDIVLGCELSRANCMVVWYKDNKKIDDNERYCSEEQGVFRSLVVLNAEIDDSGEYTCDAGDDKMVFYITVKEPPVTIIGNSGNPEHHSLVAGDKLILECEISCPNATVQWLWNGKLLSSDARTHIDSDGATRKLVLSGLQPSDSGEYILDAINDKMVTIVEVQEPPVKFVNKQARTTISGYENESVTLRAMVNREQAYVRWLKDGELLNGDNIHISSAGKMHTLTINPLKLSDSGGFVCNINTDEMYFIVQVKEMKVKFSRPLQNIVALKDSTLTLRCEVNKPKGDVQWLKDGQEIKPSRRHTIRAQGRERSITIHQLMLDNAGEYACESTDDKTFATVGVEMPPPTVEIIAELHNITVLEGEDATFKCVVSPEDTQLVWSLNGQPIVPSERFVISSNGLCHMLCIYNCQVSDCATVTAEAEGLVSEANLQVQEQQVLFTKNMVPVVAEQFGEATLEVEVGLDSGEVQWMRQGVVIHPGPKFTLKQKCRRRSLTIHKLALSDRGTYSCETLHDRTQAQLIVEPRKITIRRGLTDIQTIQRETASFEVELSHSNVEATWLKDGNQLKPNNHWRMSAKGCVHSLTISNLTLDDTGTFVLSAENVKSSARLIVKEPPVTVIKKLEDLRFPEAAVASMDCELSRPHVEVKWMKNGIEVKPRKDLRIYAMGRKHYFQILKCEVSDSGTYSCDAGDSSTSCNIAVYERELVVLQGLEDLDIQEDQNAVFVVEISLEDVPGEWFKNGVRITPTSTIKIRQEGTKHFLLMCNVRGEDSGEIKFVAKHVECTAYLEVEELPLNITNPLQDKVALERSRAIMDCSVSNPRCSIRWYKGSNVILPSERFEICSEGCYRKLVIQQVALDDEGTYSVQVGEHTCSAKLTVEAQSLLMVRELKSVEVVAPDEACFECEVSVPVLKAPVWSLKGEALQQGPKVSLEKMGMVHRLTLRQTSVDMNGLVEFTSGKAKSSAELHVKSDP
ncbi:obscurin isoform X6 [Oncorhynchus mykiss]|uniref:obscurin isoform X6 n=1 Tax=Oncorhynchus mykiss TaxID=8022 RepID=UPI001878AAC4|nr:obscurin isoform X6 [Oncorhynchus mykiss]